MYCTDCCATTLWTPIELCGMSFLMCNSCGNLVSEANTKTKKDKLYPALEKRNYQVWFITNSIVNKAFTLLRNFKIIIHKS